MAAAPPTNGPTQRLLDGDPGRRPGAGQLGQGRRLRALHLPTSSSRCARASGEVCAQAAAYIDDA